MLNANCPVTMRNTLCTDTFDRPLRDLRISVTDRCGYRCSYCMPLDVYAWMDQKELLTFEEIIRLAGLFIRLGVDRIRLTGGEPLLRSGLDKLVGGLAELEGLADLSLTTNGFLLRQQVAALAAAGLKRVNISVDTLDPVRYQRITRRDGLARVLDGISAARELGLHPIKLNAVILRGINDIDILPLAGFARAHDIIVRFIEYMDAGNTNRWCSAQLVSKAEMLQSINSRFPVRELGRQGKRSPSVDYTFADGQGAVGVIASVTEPFCSNCTRARLTADGKLVNCLFSDRAHDLKVLVRNGTTDEEIIESIRQEWSRRTDRYSEERLSAINSPAGYSVKGRAKLEMIHLGG